MRAPDDPRMKFVAILMVVNAMAAVVITAVFQWAIGRHHPVFLWNGVRLMTVIGDLDMLVVGLMGLGLWLARSESGRRTFDHVYARLTARR